MVVGYEDPDPSGASGHTTFLTHASTRRHPIGSPSIDAEVPPHDPPVGPLWRASTSEKVLDAMLHLPDEHLMRLSKAGDVRAFDTLVARHHAAVTSVARRACGPDLADDVAQAAFLSLWQHRGKYFPERGSVRHWLLAIVRNRGIDLMRSRASRRRHTVSADPHGWMIAVADEALVAEPPHVQLLREEGDASVERMLAILPPAQRTVIELAYIEGLSQQQIATKLAIPLGTVKGRLRLGLEKLRAAYEPELELLAAA
jgi:RNA polymerase sigma-70 factor (ECF subfamily)